MLRASLLLCFLTACILFTPLQAQLSTNLNLYFKTDSFNLLSEEESKLISFIKNLDNSIITDISIVGYCDDTGKKEYNDVLSSNRANYIKTILKQLNVDTSLVKKVLGKGALELKEKENKNIEKQRTHNRRVEIVINYELKKQTEKAIINDNLLSDNLKVGDKVTLVNLLFIGARHILLEESIPTLKSLVKTLQSKKKYHIKILGHICCMEFGKDGLDKDTGLMNLSEARAKSIYDYLIKNGIDAKRLDYKGLKSDFPLGKGDKFDRRVEIEITDVTTK
ncbi:MAG TPA: OmpA family protein [Saprospiraceae bacterium]|nr:OmpA family protein [Saprospiraceae bacterium]